MCLSEENQKLLAELIGTFTLVFIGAGAVAVNSLFAGSLGLVGVALAHGLALMIIVFTYGNISGAHVNPAVTIGLWVAKRIPTFTAIKYILAQLVGASIAAFLLLFIFGLNRTANIGSPDLGIGISLTTGIIIEAVLTFFLVSTVFGTAVDKRSSGHHAPIAIGFCLAAAILMGGMFTGGALNPARAFGPALASGYWNTQIVYWIGPIIGGIVAGLVYSHSFLQTKK
ncbi:MAG: MIP family channel protein [archaeon]|nr:MIP family channel protein [archaeon]